MYDKFKNIYDTKANKVTEISLKVNIDSINVQNIDTISITEKYYNSNNQITKRKENILFDNEAMEIDYFYDNSNRLEKEIVKFSFDTSTVNYFYQDTLLYKTTSKTINPEFEFEPTSNGKLTEPHIQRF